MERSQLDIAASGRRIYTPQQANALIPQVEALFRDLDRASLRAQELEELVSDLKEYWGDAVEDPDNPEHGDFRSRQAELESALRDRNDIVARFAELGCELKDVHQGLVDFYAYIEGDLAYLCWQRGEPSVTWWHTLEGGFAGRRLISES